MKSSVDSETADAQNVCAVIVCAGKGLRTNLPYNKVLHYIGQKTVIEKTLDVFSQTSVRRTVLVVSKDDLQKMTDIALLYPNTSVCLGGATRAESVKNGLDALTGNCDIVVIHDGARPFVTKEIIENSIESAVTYGSGITAVRTVDTVKRVSHTDILDHLDRSEIYCTQTPQTFRYSEIYGAYKALGTAAHDCTDDAEVYGKADYMAHIVDGDYSNTKITTAGDLFRLPTDIRIGVGFDVHRLVEGRKLVLGGVEIPYIKGLDGHSDADVLTHAIMDALLSAAGLPDIGVLFPDTDEEYLGISSMKLLSDVMKRLADAKYAVHNISAVIIAQEPKLAPYIASIRESLARAVGVECSRINVSATTTERLGIVGDGKAMAASASCLLGEA